MIVNKNKGDVNMAIYHATAKIIGRSSGRSSVAAAAYRSGEYIHNERDGISHDYTHKKDIAYKEIMLPENAPEWVNNREKLWNEVEKIENRKDSQTAREFEVALPNELNREEQISLVRDYVKENFVDRGMVADICLHDKEDGNPHAHVLLTTRRIDENGFKQKERDWNKKEILEQWREDWANKTNIALEKAGREERIDHRSYATQGIEKIPTIHEGSIARAIEQKMIEQGLEPHSERGDINREIRKQNIELAKINEQVISLVKYREEKKQQPEIQYKEISVADMRNNFEIMRDKLREENIIKTKEIAELEKQRNINNNKDIDKKIDTIQEYRKELRNQSIFAMENIDNLSKLLPTQKIRYSLKNGHIERESLQKEITEQVKIIERNTINRGIER